MIGFGAQGHAHALNLRDSGMDVIVGLYPGSKSRLRVRRNGLTVFNTPEAVRRGDIIFVALSDSQMPAIYAEQIAPSLRAEQTLLFAHGFAIYYRTIVPQKDVDVVMMAPKGLGPMGAPGVCARARRAGFDRSSSKSQQARQTNGVGVGKGNRMHACRRNGDDFSRGDGDRSFW